MTAESRGKLLLLVPAHPACVRAPELARRLADDGWSVEARPAPDTRTWCPPAAWDALCGGADVAVETLRAAWTPVAEPSVVLVAPAPAWVLSAWAAHDDRDPLVALALRASAGSAAVAAFLAPGHDTAGSAPWQALSARAAGLGARLGPLAPRTDELPDLDALLAFVRDVRLSGPTAPDLAAAKPVEVAPTSAAAGQSAFGQGLSVGAHEFAGRTVVVAAGTTREPLDPERFLSTAATGRLGWLMALAAARGGAKVTLVSGPVAFDAPTHDNLHVQRIHTCEELLRAMDGAVAGADTVLLTAVVPDFRPDKPFPTPIARSGNSLNIRFVETPDLALAVGWRKPAGQRLVQVAAIPAEATAPEALRALLEKRRLDLLITTPGASDDEPFLAPNRVQACAFGGEPVEITGIPADADGRAVGLLRAALGSGVAAGGAS